MANIISYWPPGEKGMRTTILIRFQVIVMLMIRFSLFLSCSNEMEFRAHVHKNNRPNSHSKPTISKKSHSQQIPEQKLKHIPLIVERFYRSTSVNSSELTIYPQKHQVVEEFQMVREYHSDAKTFFQPKRPFIKEQFQQGEKEKEVLDSFTHKNFGVIDVLVVLDNSSSMRNEHLKLSDKLPNLLSSLSQADWRVAVTTTDPRDGCTVNVITKDDPNPYQSFRQTVLSIGVKGTTRESGFLQAVNGLGGEDCIHEETWLRPSSNIAILFVSDEDNCSDGSKCFVKGTKSASPDYLLDYLQSIREKSLWKAYGLFWHPKDHISHCRGASFPAVQYSEIVAISGGIHGSICDDDYTEIFHQISQDVFHYLDVQFSLTSPALPESLRIFVDDEEFDGNVELTENQILKFIDLPKPNSLIKIMYRTGLSTIKNEFYLSKKPDHEKLSITIGNRLIGSHEFEVRDHPPSIRFLESPEELKTIEVEYQPLEFNREFNLETNEIVLSSINISVDGEKESHYSYDQKNKIIILDDAPDDGSEVTVSFLVAGNKKLEYDLPKYFSEIDKVSIFTNDHDERNIRYKIVNRKLKIYPEDFYEGGFISLSYDTYEGIHTSLVLPHQPIPESIEIKESNINCHKNDVKIIDKSLLESPCLFSARQPITMSYSYKEYFQSFFLPNIDQKRKGQWKIWVNDNRISKNFHISGHMIHFDWTLPEGAEIKVQWSGTTN